MTATLPMAGARLGAFLRDFDGQPRGYGEGDCVQFIGAWIANLTGHNPALEHKGSYGDEWEAAKLLRRLSGATGETALTAVIRPFCERRRVAQTGDIAVVRDCVDAAGTGTLGIVNGPLVTTVGEQGLRSLPWAGGPGLRVVRGVV